MALKFGSSFLGEFEKFRSLNSVDDFRGSVIDFAQFVARHIDDKESSLRKEIEQWRIVLFNEHALYKHQEEAVLGCIREIVLSDNKHSGYCFMPTSAGKGHILITLAGLGVGNFDVFKIIDNALPDFWENYEMAIPVMVSLGLEYSKLVSNTARTQILIHDKEILGQIEEDAKSLLGSGLASKIEFHSVQAHRSKHRRENLRYVIIDENHWGNATQEETIQSELVGQVKSTGGKAFGFTASPYEHPEGKFQRTWSHNKINSDRNFDYYLDKEIIYPITLKEVNLQNARIDYEIGDEEVELTEKSQVVDFIAANILTTIPRELDGPAICFFSPVIIPDVLGELLDKSKDSGLNKCIKVLGSPEAAFIKKCENSHGKEYIADESTIARLKKGEKIFLISQQKLLVGLNAPHLRYCFISPTNSKIKIMQGIGRLMRPNDNVDRKLAVLYLASLSGKKMDIGGKKEPSSEKEDCEKCGLKVCDCPCKTCGQPKNTECECPKASYVASSMTLSEAYDLPHKVFYKTEVGFRDFINETRIHDANTVVIVPTRHLDPEKFNDFDIAKKMREKEELRKKCYTAYKNDILTRDNHACVDCGRGMGEVNLEIHHVSPYDFIELYKSHGFEGTLKWHSNPENWENLVTLCEPCHNERHRKKAA